MSDQRTHEVLGQVLADLAHLNTGPNKNIPVRTIWLRAANAGVTNSSEVTDALNLGVAEGLFTFEPGGIAGLGTITLTDAGYNRSRT